MKRLCHLGDLPIAQPVAADDLAEQHAARLLLLFCHCGVKGKRIDSLTKMAKLDFFARYPDFFTVAAAAEGKTTSTRARADSRMIRYRYGPWDERYYRLLAYLEALDLLRATRNRSSFVLELTEKGQRLAKQLSDDSAFTDLVAHMKQVKRVLGGKTGTGLKKLIYELFENEVGERPIGEVID